jgi:hypothetical protein
MDFDIHRHSTIHRKWRREKQPTRTAAAATKGDNNGREVKR